MPSKLRSRFLVSLHRANIIHFNLKLRFNLLWNTNIMVLHLPMYISVLVVANAKMKEAKILLVHEIIPTILSSSFKKSLNILMENRVPERKLILVKTFFLLNYSKIIGSVQNSIALKLNLHHSFFMYPYSNWVEI